MLLMLVVMACTPALDRQTRSPEAERVTMPSPDGCYVQVWDGPQHTGTSDYINGPRAYAELVEMPNGRRWDNRIASVRVGPSATATAYVDDNFEGASLQLDQRAAYPTLPADVTGRIASLRIDCTP